MICEKCGKQLNEGELYCDDCNDGELYCDDCEIQQTRTTYVPNVNEDMSFKAQSTFQLKISEYNDKGVAIDELTEAKLFAQSIELVTLKSPFSAVFCSLEEMSVSIQNGIYTISGWVDSQNSYGAMIRTPFTIEVTKINGVWKTISKFINSYAAAQATAKGNFIVYWIIGILMTIISYFIFKAII